MSYGVMNQNLKWFKSSSIRMDEVSMEVEQ